MECPISRDPILQCWSCTYASRACFSAPSVCFVSRPRLSPRSTPPPLSLLPMSSVDAREVKVAIAHDACGGGCGGGGGGAVEVRASARCNCPNVVERGSTARGRRVCGAPPRFLVCHLCTCTRELGALLSFVRWVAREVRAER
jgi:hypothetical protein